MMSLLAAIGSPILCSIAISLATSLDATTAAHVGNEGELANSTIMRSDTAKPGLMHVVHFWLDPALSDGEVEDFLAGVRSLADVPTVRDFHLGEPAATPSRGVVDNSFDYSLVVWFDDVPGHDAYQEHPIHLAFVEAHEAKFARVRVRDSASL